MTRIQSLCEESISQRSGESLGYSLSRIKFTRCVRLFCSIFTEYPWPWLVFTHFDCYVARSVDFFVFALFLYAFVTSGNQAYVSCTERS